MSATATLVDRDQVASKVERLSTASLRRVMEPDVEVAGEPGPGQVLPDELLPVDEATLATLTAEQKRVLSREAVASVAQSGIRFEAVLCAGFAAQMASAPDLTDPRLTYLLHEMGEETRHQRLFQRLIASLEPKAKPPVPTRVLRFTLNIGMSLFARSYPLLYVLVLGGEEIPDLFQKLAGEHPDTDDFVRAVNKYHRSEEARHLGYARACFPELMEDAGFVDRFLVRTLAPLIIRSMYDLMFQPNIYAEIGLPTRRTWKAMLRSKKWTQNRYDATRSVLKVLLDSGSFRGGRVPRLWRSLCGVDRTGSPIEA